MQGARGIARMPGTCGELVQGTLDGVNFHVTCPVNIYSEVEVGLDAAAAGLEGPWDAPKALAALRAVLGRLPANGHRARLEIRSKLPRGKGMASSTADIAGTIYAACSALGIVLTPAEVAEAALAIEPTDGSIFPGIVLFNHRTGSLFEPLGTPPPIDLIVLDFGGTVDTLAFNRIDRTKLLRSLEPQVGEALGLVKAGLAEVDVELVGRGTTLSALANQTILFKPQLEAVIRLSEEIGAAGVTVAHSGTVIGVLLDRRRGDAYAGSKYLQQWLPPLERATVCQLIGGGPSYYFGKAASCISRGRPVA